MCHVQNSEQSGKHASLGCSVCICLAEQCQVNSCLVHCTSVKLWHSDVLYRPATISAELYADYLASFPSFCTCDKSCVGTWEQICLLLHLRPYLKQCSFNCVGQKSVQKLAINNQMSATSVIVSCIEQ